MKLLKIVKSDKRGKKMMAVFSTNDGRTKTIHFGQASADDYTLTRNTEQRVRYLSRHRNNENWSKPDSPGALARWVLWNLPTKEASIADYKRRFNL